MKLRRTLVLLTVSAAALTMSGAATAAPVESGQGERRVLDLDLPGANSRAAADGSLFTSVSPTRVLDTRTGTGVPGPGPVPGGGTVTLDLSSRVPVGTTAVVLNLTGVAPTVSSYVTVWPTEASRPVVSNLNLAAGEVRANAVTVALGPSRSLSLFNYAGSINLVADLAGHYSLSGDALYNTRSPQRVLDTRQAGGPIPQGGTITVDTSEFLASTGVQAITLNLTVVSPTAGTYLTAFPTGTARPTASSINAARGTVTANQVTVRVGQDKDIRLYNNAGRSHVVVDLVGDYDTSFGDAFYPIIPTRVFDTRTDGGGPLMGGYYYPIAVADEPTDPEAQYSSLVLNVTGTGGTTSTYLTLYPSGSPLPVASTINLAARQTAANLATTALGWDSDEIGPYYGFNVYNYSGRIHVVLDWAGYFAPPTP